MDGQFILQWSLLKKMTDTKSYYTSDPVLDSWFFVLFSHAVLHDRSNCTVASLSTLVSPLPTTKIQSLSEVILPAALNNLYCFNFWHLLEFLYFPLNINKNHWILIRVGIQSQIIEIFDSLGNQLGRMIQDVSHDPFFPPLLLLIVFTEVESFLNRITKGFLDRSSEQRPSFFQSLSNSYSKLDFYPT